MARWFSSAKFKQAAAPQPCIVETMESRRLSSVSYYTSNSSAQSTGTYYGAVLFGDNGDDSGTPTSMLGQSSQIAGFNYACWDDDLSDGVDSGTVNTLFSFNTSSAHTATWLVDGQGSGTLSLAPTTSVQSVELRASVSGPGLGFSWSNVTISFYSGSTVVESVTVNDFSADTIGSMGWSPAEAGAVITPTASNVTGVAISAKFNMQADIGTYPTPTDLAGQIFVS